MVHYYDTTYNYVLPHNYVVHSSDMLRFIMIRNVIRIMRNIATYPLQYQTSAMAPRAQRIVCVSCVYLQRIGCLALTAGVCH